MMTGALDNPLGDGSARENNVASLVLVSVFGPIGMVVVAIIIAAVVREQAHQFALDIRHEENMAFVTRALENLNIPAELQRRVVSLHYFQKMSHDSEAFYQLFSKHHLSGPLEDAIRVYLYQKVISSQFFANGGPNYLLAVVRVLEDRMFLPGDYVARRGEVGAEMFFISHGELSVHVPGGNSDDIASAVLIPGRKRRGQYFGEIALLQRSLRTAWVRAETYVIVSVLHRARIEEIWEFFPREREKLVSVVTETMERDKQRGNRARWQEAFQDVARAGAAGHKTSVGGRPSLPPSSGSRSRTGACAVDELGMCRKDLDGSIGCPEAIAENLRVLREGEERRHAQAMEVAKIQHQRLQAVEQEVSRLGELEKQVSALVALLADPQPSGSKAPDRPGAAGGQRPTVLEHVLNDLGVGAKAKEAPPRPTARRRE
mmetsp:Transcript_123494/g.384394  ORF Transcript_123494/g.384394 Transcript_123494/m.384394 type:complete len:431 (+) Transcript_123494:1133-2425(+)